MKEITDKIAALQKTLKVATTKPLKDKLRVKIAELKQELKDANIPVAKYAKSLIGSQRKVAAMTNNEFKAAIKKLSNKPSYSFLKGYSVGKVQDDLKRYAKPVGWRFKGRNKIKKPTATELAIGKRKGTVYYEDRADRSDVVYPVKLERGGMIKATSKVNKMNDKMVVEEVYTVYQSEFKDNNVTKSDLLNDINIARKMLIQHYFDIYEETDKNTFAKGGSLKKLKVGDSVLIKDKNSFHRGKSGVISGDGDDFWIVKLGKNQECVVRKNYVEKFAKGGSVTKKELLSSDYYENGGGINGVFTCPPRKIDDESLKELTEMVLSLPQTKSMHTDKNGNYTDERKALHKKLILEFKKDVVCITKGQPIAILMGGSPASGKSSFVKKFRPYLLTNNIMKIDADEIRAKLPEYSGCNATQTHLETKDIVNTLISDKNIGVPCEFDMLYDGTMNNVRSYEPLIQMLRKRNYKIYIIYIDNVDYDTVVSRMKQRYVKTGRFVPIEVIDDFFSKGKSALNRLKHQVDGYVIVDGSTYDYDVIERGGEILPEEREYKVLGEIISKKELEGSEYKKGGVTKKQFQAKKMGKVMHEFKQGDLHIGKSDKIVKNREQAIAIGLSEVKRGWKNRNK